MHDAQSHPRLFRLAALPLARLGPSPSRHGAMLGDSRLLNNLLKTEKEAQKSCVPAWPLSGLCSRARPSRFNQWTKDAASASSALSAWSVADSGDTQDLMVSPSSSGPRRSFATLDPALLVFARRHPAPRCIGPPRGPARALSTPRAVATQLLTVRTRTFRSASPSSSLPALILSARTWPPSRPTAVRSRRCSSARLPSAPS